MTNGRQKGASGEREFSKLLTEQLGVSARRSQQYAGGSVESSDVLTELPYHFEVKRVEKLNLAEAMAQAIRDGEASGMTPLVVHRRNRGEWLLTVRFSDISLISGKLTID
jgi:hypothetical protein